MRVFFIVIASFLLVLAVILFVGYKRSVDRDVGVLQAAVRRGMMALYVKTYEASNKTGDTSEFTKNGVESALMSHMSKSFPGYRKVKEIAITSFAVKRGETNLLFTIQTWHDLRLGVDGKGAVRMIFNDEYVKWPHVIITVE